MVLEKLVPESWLEQKPVYGLLLGIGYSIIGIILASLIFKKDPAIPSVAFTSLFLIPIIRKVFLLEEQEKTRDSKFRWNLLFNQHKDVFFTYFFLFFGIFLVFSVAAAVLPGFQVNKLFREQLGLRAGAATGALAISDQTFALNPEHPLLPGQQRQSVFFVELFWNILKNNWWVFLATLAIGLIAGDGGVFFITWNASVWGTIFGVTARNAAIFHSGSALVYLGIILGIVFPHMFLEIGSYILAGIGAGMFSMSIGEEKFLSEKMNKVIAYSVGLVAIGLLFLVAGAIVETYVLGNNATYQAIIQASYFGQ